jgi:hypothetical protein
MKMAESYRLINALQKKMPDESGTVPIMVAATRLELVTPGL